MGPPTDWGAAPPRLGCTILFVYVLVVLAVAAYVVLRLTGTVG